MATVSELPHTNMSYPPSFFEDLLLFMESDPFSPPSAGVGEALEQLLFQISDHLAFDEGSQPGGSLPLAVAGEDESRPQAAANGTDNSIMVEQTSCRMECEGTSKRAKKDSSPRIGFRTRSTIEVLEDGYKWRKYGKKSVKSSPNLRNYYRCSTAGCGVKKRVERDADDASYVITVYEGTHNHLPTGAVYYPVPVSGQHATVAPAGDIAAAAWGSSSSAMSTMRLDPQRWETHGAHLP
ncbi:unnamed protein product [Spirodela intermedia]|uniref:WRKY domain-containing protein n=1 Tax=Spirodela intermedia TaxID=51605 RepID=A0A7I8L069_SPIIN|nr:unnamed protein product [Spirodela intermedia]